MGFMIYCRALPRSFWKWLVALFVLQTAIAVFEFVSVGTVFWIDTIFGTVMGVWILWLIAQSQLDCTIREMLGILRGANLCLEAYGEKPLDPEKVLVTIDNCNLKMDFSIIRNEESGESIPEAKNDTAGAATAGDDQKQA